MDKLSYALGMSIAHNMMSSGVKELVYEDFKAAVQACMQGDKTELSPDEATEVLNKFFEELEAARAAEQAEIGAVMKKLGEEFLEKNKSESGVITLESGLQYKVLKEGDSDKFPTKDSSVKCHYEGRFVDGKVFDSSYKRGEPATFGVTQVIKGWTEALQLMSVGSKWQLYIPYQLAYGETGAAGAIPPYATLVFDVELIEIV